MKLPAKYHEPMLGYLLIIPIVILIIGLIGFPVLNTLYLSLTNKRVGLPPKFIWFKNYIDLFKTPTYWRVLFNTFIYMGVAVACKLFFGMILALTLNEKFFGRTLVRVLLLLPWTIPGMVSAMVWKWMYNDTYGIINALLLRWDFIDLPIPWLSGMKIVLFSVIIVNIWCGIPFFLFSILGALQTLDRELYDAAEIDGANALQRYFYITLPSILPVVQITLLLSSIWTFNDFENVFLITGGGPLNASSIIATFTYELAFLYNDLGKALSVAVSVVPILVVLVFFALRNLAKAE